MKTLKRWTTKLLILVLAVLPGACHYNFTGPALWSHQSSYAFETWALMWTACIVLFFLALAFDPDAP
jgi:hypothetical protein